MLSSSQIYYPNNNMIPNNYYFYSTLTHSTFDIDQELQNRQNFYNKTYLNSSNIFNNPYYIPTRNSVSLENASKNIDTRRSVMSQNSNLYSSQNIKTITQQDKLKLSYSPPSRQFKPRSSLPNDNNLNEKNNNDYKKLPNYDISDKSFDIISAYGSNTCNGRVRNYNEDKVKILLDYQLKKESSFFDFFSWNRQPKISYFAIFDGHGGSKCSEFLKNNFHNYIFKNSFFPDKPMNAIYQAFKNCEKDFNNMSFKNGKLLDSSGSCAIIALILDNICYLINLGDSRALYSCNKGKNLYQITRDHKPDDPKEKERIIKNGGQVYMADFLEFNGKKYSFKNVNFGPGFKFPYRLFPGKLSVSLFIFNKNNFLLFIFFMNLYF